MVLLCRSALGVIIPSSRVADWTQVGIEGGIPTVTTVFATVTVSIPGTNLVATANGSTDDAPALQAAINLCPSNQVVYLPAGTYWCATRLMLADGVVLRGAGSESTIIRGAIAAIGSSAVVDAHTVYSGGTAGSTNITISGGFSNPPEQLLPGWICTVESNGPTNLVYPMGNEGPWPQPCFGQQIELLTVGSGRTNFTFRPPLYSDVGPSAVVVRHYDGASSNYRRYAGVENLRLVHTNLSDHAVHFEEASRCWVRGCEIVNSKVEAVYVARSFRCVIASNYVHDTVMSGSGGGYGVDLWARSSGCLVEDNIFINMSAYVLVDDGASGNVVAYNYGRGSTYYDPTALTGRTVNSHSAHPQRNLFEGCDVAGFAADAIHGSSSHHTLLRNRLAGWASTNITVANFAVALNATNWFSHVIGCVLGTPGRTTTYEIGAGTGVPFSFGTPAIFAFGYFGGTNAADTAARSTAIIHGNYDVVTGAQVWDAGVADHAIPASYYRPSKPDWFGNMSWPPIDPASPVLDSTVPLIPAHARAVGSNYMTGRLAALPIAIGNSTVQNLSVP